MLVANRKNGEKFSLGDHLMKSELLKWRRQEDFYCPECGEGVILKLGDKRIWHFAHQKGSSCPQRYERESDYHLLGKLEIYHWLREKGVKVELERYIAGCKQRADVAFELKQKRYAVEFQCSPISEELFKRRTEGYRSNGITPIWILGGNQIRRLAANIVSFNHFHSLFLRRLPLSWGVSVYCPQLHHFIFLHDILPISSKKAIVAITALSRSDTQLIDLINPVRQKKVFVSTWKYELQKLKTSYYIYPNSAQRIFLNDLYQNKLNLQTLPPEIGLPVLSAPYLETSPLVWQTYLYLDIFRHLKGGDVFSYRNVYHSLLLRINRQQVKIRNLPFENGGGVRMVIEEYLTLLVQLSRLRLVEPTTYQVIRPFEIPKSVEEQAIGENNFYQTYEQIIAAQL